MLVTAALALLAAYAQAAAETLQLDSSRLSIRFEVRTLGLWRLGGSFESAWGEVELDRNEPSRSRMKVVARTDSVSTGLKHRDEELRSEHFFHAARFPTISFESTAIALADATSGIVTGNLVIRGVTRPVRFAFRLSPARPLARSPHGLIEAAGTVQRSNWGMTAFIPAISDEVVLDIRARIGD